jgi:hypothetical protein
MDSSALYWAEILDRVLPDAAAQREHQSTTRVPPGSFPLADGRDEALQHSSSSIVFSAVYIGLQKIIH